MSKTEEALARELHAHRHDPDEWSEEPVPITVRQSRTAILSVRLPLDELDGLEEAAQAAGESLSDYVRKAVVVRRTDSLGTKSTPVAATRRT